VQLRNLRATARLVSEKDVGIEPFASAGKVWSHGYHTDGPDGPGTTLMLARAVGDFVVVVSASGQPAWDWTSVSDLGASQARRLTEGTAG